jgi:hypothetical protein
MIDPGNRRLRREGSPHFPGAEAYENDLQASSLQASPYSREAGRHTAWQHTGRREGEAKTIGSGKTAGLAR